MWNTSYLYFALTVVAVGSSVADARRLHKRECSFTWPATNGDTCATISRDWLIAEELFKAMNTGVDCSKLVPGQEYCVEWSGSLPTAPVISPTPTPTPTPPEPSSTTLVTKTSSAAPSGPAVPSPIQPGVAQNCQNWYLVVSGDTCQKIVDNYGTFTLSQFYQWNPAVGTNCALLQADVFVCVGVPGAPAPVPTPAPTSSAKPSATPTPVNKPCRWNESIGQYVCPGVWPAAPGPTQDGVPYNCVEWVLQKDGVYCVDMAKGASITLDRFYSLNPAVGSNCGGLWAGYAYCIATGY